MTILRYIHMNPQDLLYTNQFVGTNILDNSELKKSTQYYKQYQNHVDKTADITKQYLNRSLKDGDPINVNKAKSKPWPILNEKNYKPIFSDTVSDIVENKYIKAIKTIISIYSKDRNKEKALMPNNYLVNLGKEFINIYKIKLVDLNIPNSIPPVNTSNNVISWIYPTANMLNYTNSSTSLYPFLTSYSDLYPYFFYYSTISSMDADTNTLPDITNSIINEPEDIYTCLIGQGFYNTKQMEQQLKKKMNTVLHKIQEGIISSYKTDLNNGGLPRYNSGSRLVRNSPHNFYININPYQSSCCIINRAEEVNIIAIQTLPQTSMYSPYYDYIKPSGLMAADDNTQDKTDYQFLNDIFWSFFYYVKNNNLIIEDTDFTHTNIMDGRYLFNKNTLTTNLNKTNYLESKSNEDLPGAEIKNNAPSFIITVKDIGHLFGGINVKDYLRSGTQFKQEDVYTYENNCFPVVFTDIPSIGGIDKGLINEVEFYDYFFLYEKIQYSSDTPNIKRLQTAQSFYYHFDDIRIGTEIFKRYAFYIHTNSFLNRPNYYFRNAGFINCHTQENIIISKSLYSVLSSGNPTNCSSCDKPAQYNKKYNKDYQGCFQQTSYTAPDDTAPDDTDLTGIINNSMNICYFGDYITGEQSTSTQPKCGRALPMAFKNNFTLVDGSNRPISDPCTLRRTSILSLLGWSNEDKNISNYSPFKFIHRNTDYIPSNTEEYASIISNRTPIPIKKNSTDNLDTANTCYNEQNTCGNDVEYNFSSIPQNLMNLEQIGTDVFVFRSIPFIFLKLSFPSLSDDTISDQLIKTTSDKLEGTNIYDKYYINPLTNLNDLGINYQNKAISGSVNTTEEKLENDVILEKEKAIYKNCGFKTSKFLLKKDANIVFAKINLNPVPGNSFNKQHYDFEYIFYDKPLQSVNTMKVELLSPDGELLNFRQEHHITLEMMEFRDVLKETLFDTRHGEIVTTGIKKV